MGTSSITTNASRSLIANLDDEDPSRQSLSSKFGKTRRLGGAASPFHPQSSCDIPLSGRFFGLKIGAATLLYVHMTRQRDPIAQLECDGRVWIRNALKGEDLAAFDQAWDLGARPGARLTTTGPLSQVLAVDGPLSAIVGEFLPFARAVRVISFNKTPQSNWGVPWHQDRVISVRQKHALPGYGNWSRKVGIWHCEPPVDLLDRMLFARLHLDDTDHENGALQIVLGSHREGVVPADTAAQIGRSRPTEVCQAKRGDLLILKMLTLHRSLPSKSTPMRRTYRIDYASDALPAPLEWLALG